MADHVSNGKIIQQEVFKSCEADTVALAEEAVQAGLIKHDVLDHLTALHPQVPNSMKHRYLFRHIFEATKGNEHLFMRMVQMLLQFQKCQGASTNSSMTKTPLNSGHISSLTEFLARHAYKWESIGTVLGFKPEDLKNIRANNAIMGSMGVERNLNEMLGTWIEGKYKYTLPPTLESLETALNSVVVGLGVLASEVKTN